MANQHGPGVRPRVVVVGAGISGAAAALELASAGIPFHAFDAEPGFGGTARRGGVSCSVAGSPMQDAHGIDDSPGKALQDLLTSNPDADEEWAGYYYQRAVADVYGWYRSLGVEFEEIWLFEGDSVPRWHKPVGAGRRLMELAWNRLSSLGVRHAWQFGTTLTDLLREGDRVVGVRLSRKGESIDVPADAVILATGGFAGNLDMVEEADSPFNGAERVLAGGSATARGSVHAIVAKHNGLLTHMNNVYGYANGTPDYRDPSGRRGVVVRGVRNWIWVNADGRRFHNESLYLSGRTATPTLLKQPGATCWAVLDSTALAELDIFDHFAEPATEDPESVTRRFLSSSPYFLSADDPRELAGTAGFDGTEFANTLREWNALVSSGKSHDPLTGRALNGLRPIAGEKLYAIRFFPTARKTLGGVRTDLRAQVVDQAGRPISGLFASGELAGMAGGHLAGSRPLEGIMAGGSVFSGRIAARSVAKLYGDQ